MDRRDGYDRPSVLDIIFGYRTAGGLDDEPLELSAEGGSGSVQPHRVGGVPALPVRGMAPGPRSGPGRAHRGMTGRPRRVPPGGERRDWSLSA